MSDLQAYMLHNRQDSLRTTTSLDEFASVLLDHATRIGEQPALQQPTQLTFISKENPSYSSNVGNAAFAVEMQQNAARIETTSVFEHTDSPMGFSTSSFVDEYSADPRFLESQNELRTLLFTTAHSIAPTRAGSPVGPHQTFPVTPGSNLSSEPTLYTTSIISTEKRVTWFKNYIEEVAPWLDMFDVQQTFGREVPILAQSSPALVWAILAISARQMERKKRLRGDHESLQLYQEAIRSLTPQVLTRGPNIMATCVILCCLEMMSAAPRNWRKHLDGCAALFSSYGIHGFSGGILQGTFWCYARMDVCASIISEGDQSAVLALERWLPPDVAVEDAGHLFRTGVPDIWADYAVWLTARACHLVWSLTNEIEGQDISTRERFIISWVRLWDEIQSWRQDRPAELLQLEFGNDSQQSKSAPFPFILFAAPCAISSNQLYHTACLLLLDIKPESIISHEMGRAGSNIWHARQICGISTTNEHHGCLNNAIQPLWVAGKLLSHPAEHKAIVDLISRIESITGWDAKWRIRDLKEIWGCDQNTTL